MRSYARTHYEHRPTSIDLDFIENAHGSVLFTMGKTKVLCAASISLGVPKFLRDKPQGWLTAEYSMLPASTNNRMDRESTRGKQQGRTLEIQRLIGRSLRSCLNLKKIPGYTLTIDCDVLQADGGTRSAAITGGYIAMVRAIQYFQYKGTFKHDPLVNSVTAISVGIDANNMLVDLDYKEDERIGADINLVLNQKHNIVEIQGTAERQTFSVNQLQNIILAAVPAITSLQAIQQSAIETPITS